MTTVLQATTNKSPKRKLKPTDKIKQNSQIPTAVTETPINRVTNQAEKVAKEQSLVWQESDTQDDSQDYVPYLNKSKTLLYALETNFWACDAKWTLFVSAAYSYRYAAVLQPFPPQFVTEQSGYDIDALISVIKDTPKLSIISQSLVEQIVGVPSTAVIDLLYWVLVVMREPSLRLVEGEELNSLLTSIDEQPIKIRPTHVFKVNALSGYHSEVAFRARTKNNLLKMAFMGNKFDNYFSILFNGLKPLKDNTINLKLTTNLQTSLRHSPYGAAWGASQCGSLISCTAICECAIDPEEDKILPNKNEESCVDIHLNDPENIRVRYLIFYGRRFPRSLLRKPLLFSWIYNHKFSLSFWSYLLFLVSIGVVNSDNGEIFKLYLCKKFDLFVEFCRRFITKDPGQFL